jgi:hypothetical protein
MSFDLARLLGIKARESRRSIKNGRIRPLTYKIEATL